MLCIFVSRSLIGTRGVRWIDCFLLNARSPFVRFAARPASAKIFPRQNKNASLFRCNTTLENISVTDDGGQNIIEIMRNPSGQLTDGFPIFWDCCSCSSRAIFLALHARHCSVTSEKMIARCSGPGPVYLPLHICPDAPDSARNIRNVHQNHSRQQS